MNSFLFAPNPVQNFNPKSFYVKESNLVSRLENGNSISLNCNNLTILSSPSILTYVRQTLIFYKVFIFNSFTLMSNNYIILYWNTSFLKSWNKME